jgi:amphi-Trp domain-containing protein
MPEEQLFKTERRLSRTEVAEALRDAAEGVESGSVTLESDTDSREVAVPENPRFEVELEVLTDSETGEQRYELEYEVRWTREGDRPE